MLDTLSYEAQLEHLQNVAQQALKHWALPAKSQLTLLSLSENATYRVDAHPLENPLVMRIHRTQYHSKSGIQTELDWMKALQEDTNIKTPQAIAGRNGEHIQEISTAELNETRFITLFHFIEGEEPNESELIQPFIRLGEVTGKMHLHAQQWKLPPYFDRLVWDYNGCIGHHSNWGDWRDGPGLNPADIGLLEAVSLRIKQRLNAFGMDSTRFGLIHSDIRLANILICGDETRVIDFDDCGLGWFLYDLASAVSFIETHPQFNELIAAWVTGYRKSVPLSPDEEAEIPTFIMLRRLTLFAWLGSHPDADLAKQIGNSFAEGTVELGKHYLETMPLI